jgi:hypothetical protein
MFSELPGIGYIQPCRSIRMTSASVFKADCYKCIPFPVLFVHVSRKQSQ